MKMLPKLYNGNSRYVQAHPKSQYRLNELVAYYHGLDLVAIQPDGILVYKICGTLTRLYRWWVVANRKTRNQFNTQ
jgi:hypothetical protein